MGEDVRATTVTASAPSSLIMHVPNSRCKKFASQVYVNSCSGRGSRKCLKEDFVSENASLADSAPAHGSDDEREQRKTRDRAHNQSTVHTKV